MVNKREFIIFAVGAILGLLSGFFIGKGIYDRPLDESVKRDTVWLTDTVPDLLPTPKDSAHIKWVTRWLPKLVHDTIDNVVTEVNFLHDTVAVQVPITSMHYKGEHYDAYVSGFEPRLDSIFVYNETQIITETITRMKPPNKLSLSVNAGVDYGIKSEFFQPYASGELTLNNHKRLQLGVEGGVKKNEVTAKFEPFAGAKLKLKVF